mgnify:CR=1 FL=1
MKQPVFTGAAVAIITPMHADGTVNFEELGRIIDDQIAHGTDAIVVCGTTGEASTMSYRERMRTIEFCVDHVDGRLPVIAGTGSNSTENALALSRDAERAGADGLLLVTPYYNKASQTGLIKHYEYIAERIELPMILYNVPSRTGVSFTAESYKVLAQNPKINGVKEASGNFSLLAHTRHICPDDFYVWSGNDDQVVPMMALGAKGVISVVSNIAPELMVKMSHLCLESASGSKVLKDSGIGFLCFEDARINGTSFLLAHTLNIFAFLVVEFFRLNTFTVNLGDCICIRIQTAVAINTDKDKCRNNQNHGDKHQPTSVSYTHLTLPTKLEV